MKQKMSISNPSDQKEVQTSFDYHFNELEKWIIGDVNINPGTLFFTIFGNKAPSLGDKILYEGKVFECNSVIDVTEENEFKQGLSYSNIEFVEI